MQIIIGIVLKMKQENSVFTNPTGINYLTNLKLLTLDIQIKLSLILITRQETLKKSSSLNGTKFCRSKQLNIVTNKLNSNKSKKYFWRKKQIIKTQFTQLPIHSNIFRIQIKI